MRQLAELHAEQQREQRGQRGQRGQQEQRQDSLLLYMPQQLVDPDLLLNVLRPVHAEPQQPQQQAADPQPQQPQQQPQQQAADPQPQQPEQPQQPQPPQQPQQQAVAPQPQQPQQPQQQAAAPQPQQQVVAAQQPQQQVVAAQQPQQPEQQAVQEVIQLLEAALKLQRSRKPLYTAVRQALSLMRVNYMDMEVSGASPSHRSLLTFAVLHYCSIAVLQYCSIAVLYIYSVYKSTVATFASSMIASRHLRSYLLGAN